MALCVCGSYISQDFSELTVVPQAFGKCSTSGSCIRTTMIIMIRYWGGWTIAISPCEPLRLNYYVYFMNSASSSRFFGGRRKQKTTSICVVSPSPRHEFIYSGSPCEPLRLNYHAYFMNTASSSRSTGGEEKISIPNTEAAVFVSPPPPPPGMRLCIAYSTNITVSLKFTTSTLRNAYMVYVFTWSMHSGCELSKLFKPALVYW